MTFVPHSRKTVTELSDLYYRTPYRVRLVIRKDMILFLAISSFVCFFLSWLLNLLLLGCLAYHKATQLGGYRLISFAIVVFDMLFSAAYAITVPLFHTDGGELLLLIPVGYTSSLSKDSFLGSLVRPAYAVWHGCMITTSFLVAATFAYRYTVICNSKRFKQVYYSKVVRAIAFVFCAGFSLAQGILLDYATSPQDKLTNTMNRLVSATYGVNFSQVYYQGNDMTDPEMLWRARVGMTLSGLFQVSFVAITIFVFYSGRRIYTVIHRNAYSRRTQMKQQQVFRMLVCQAVSPFLFLYLPPLIDAASVTFGFSLPMYACIAKAFLVYLFPIANPLAIIIFTEDYRYFLRNARQRIQSESSINTVALKSTYRRSSIRK